MQKHPQDDSEISNKSEESETAASSDNPSETENHKRFVYLDIGSAKLTSRRIVIELFFEIVPLTCENFWQLCVQSRKIGSNGKPLSYKNSLIHRIQAGFLVQGGDIVNYDGTGGESVYGPTFKDENFRVKLDPGTVGMVNCGKDTNSSQFFISVVDHPHLEGTNVGFGKVVKGLRIVDEISNLPHDDNTPKEKIFITDCGALPADQEKWNYGEDDGLDRYPAYPEDWEQCKDSPPENWAKDLKQAITNIKNQGNIFLSRQEFERATNKYTKAIRYLNWAKTVKEDVFNDFVDLFIACLSNLAKVNISCKNFRHAHEHCSEVLKLKDSAKAYFRRGQANYGLHNYDAALEDLSKAQLLEPCDTAIFQSIRAVKIAKERAKYEDKQRFANMLK